MLIPPGTYEIELYDSPKHGPNTPQLRDVPGRSNIQIHIANYPHELEGCIAVGQCYIGESLTHSADAFRPLQALIATVINRGDAVTINIIDS